MPSPIKKASEVPLQSGTTAYPPGWRERLNGRHKARLGDAVGISHFGINLTHLEPGAWSSLRHWHEGEDEFVYVLAGEVTLVDEQGEHPMRPGDCAGFPAGVPNGHHLINKSDQAAIFFEVGSRRPGADVIHYADEDWPPVKR
jgi:uncharacterized cupin superfamily protein